ncbi:putative Fe-S cluster assembly protein SufT [Alloalcanivorax mobilis]|uniref:putative Fe-S cluster assembly protein SufT n=1 Tax=Alloalcanivorax mobilis TaxID=2019569 RepID=UPI000B5B0E7F|nr:putative Fe-S cluster assembly protein SufT [Alloalcanivorax mobilis]ASK33190.1 putative Fe-S cluster assembly protein SufT [Alcanivorax sp. N3-2A]ASK36633.1 putative Fe-S cluster assembly protein SufT [Alcanivorax sp. N3-2A]
MATGSSASEQRTVVVSRDVPARLVPDGTRITIHKNTFVNLRQALGGTYTVTVNGNMARIDGTDADAIGQTPLELDFDPPRADGQVREQDLQHALGTIFDPEIPVNIVDLGLVYGCDVIQRTADSGEKQNVVQVRMTLTAPNCGMGPVLVGDVEDRLAKVPNVDAVEVALIFDPPWSREMMTEEAQLELGLF